MTTDQISCELSIDQIAHYWRDGYLVVPDVLPPALCEQIIERAHEFDTARRGVFDPVMQPHVADPWFRGVLEYPGVVSMIRDILGQRPDGLQTLFYFGRPAPRGFILHQDNYCVEAPDNDFLSAWIALTDVTKDNGCLRVFPATHTKGILPVRSLGSDEINDQFGNMTDSPQLALQSEPVDVPVGRGSVVILHGNVLHCSNPNLSSGFRYAHLNTYIRPGSSYRPGNTARRRAESIPQQQPAGA